MAKLYLHHREISSVFELLGTNENDITCSIGWSLSRSPYFLKSIIREIFSKSIGRGYCIIRLQEHGKDKGYTDIEIEDDDIHVIVEAKRGWNLPSLGQLEGYAGRIGKRKKYIGILVLAECTHEYAQSTLEFRSIRGIPVVFMNWRDIERISHISGGTYGEKQLMQQLRTYLRSVVNMRDQRSNVVYVVPLKKALIGSSKISWIDIVEKRGRYFSPVKGKGYPKVPPNYLGFRYDGELKRIHHMESWEVVKRVRDRIPEIKKGDISERDHYLFKLGPPIIPQHKVRSGKIYPSGHHEVAIDLLLTCNTVEEAFRRTKKRMAKG